MSDLKGELESLRIDRARPAGRGRRWFALGAVLLLVAAGILWFARSRGAFAAVAIDTVRPAVQRTPSAVPPGSAILTASGYLVPRRKAVVSAKIQGRLSELRHPSISFR